MLMVGEEETIAHFRFEAKEFGVFESVGGDTKVLPTFDDLWKGIDICFVQIGSWKLIVYFC